MVNPVTLEMLGSRIQTTAQAPVRKRYLCSWDRITSTRMFQSKLTWGLVGGQGHLHLYFLEPLVSEEHCDVCSFTTGRKTGTGSGGGSTALCPQGGSSATELRPGLRRTLGAGGELRQKLPENPFYSLQPLQLFLCFQGTWLVHS